MTPLMSTRNLGCVLGKKTVLAGVDLDLAPGEVLGVVGPNGAGKSTLVHCVQGTRRSTGSVVLEGRALGSWSLNAIARTVGYLSQTVEVEFGFTVRDLVALGRHPHRGRFEPFRPHDDEAVTRALAATETLDLADRSVQKLSGGERQRVLLARVLAQEPTILLLDEPTAHVDWSFQETVFALVRRWVGTHRGVIAVVHDLRLAARHCDRLVLLAEGRVVAAGPPHDVLTPEHLGHAFGRPVWVWENPVTGEKDYRLRSPVQAQPRVHVIGGGGAGAPVIRTLAEAGWSVTIGVLSPGDVDHLVAQAYGASVVLGPPFTPPTLQAQALNRGHIDQADLTVVTNLEFGPANLGNLEAALTARRLVVLEDTPPENRDFTGGLGLGMYRRLAARATVLRTAELGPWLKGFPDGL